MADIVKVALLWLAATGMSLGWVHLSSQSKVPRSHRNSAVIALRLLGIVALSYAVFCAWLGLSVDAFLITALITTVLSSVVTLEGDPADNAIGFAAFSTIVLPVYVLKQFVLGFPDYGEIIDNVVLAPPDVFPPSEDFARLSAALGTVDATMRPCGTVRIDGSVYPATTFDGRYLKAGTPIRVTGSRDSFLVVEASTPDCT